MKNVTIKEIVRLLRERAVIKGQCSPSRLTENVGPTPDSEEERRFGRKVEEHFRRKIF